MTLQQKRKRNLILMLVVMVLAIASLVGLSIYKNRQEDAAKGTRITKVSPKDITELTFYRADTDQTVSLALDADGIWRWTDYPEANLIQGYVKYMCNSLTEVRLQKKVSEEDASQFGLDEPRMVITAKAGDETIRLTVGDENAAKIGHYVTFGDSNDVWLMGAEYFHGIDYTGGSLVYPETIQPLTTASLLHLVREQDGAVMELDLDAGSTSAGMLRMTEPYHGEVFASKLKMSEFIDIYNMLAFDSCYDYDCRDFSKYGFDNPKMRLEVTFRDVEGNDVDYMLEFGGKNADGDYYVRTNYTNHVNIINSTNAYTFLTFDVFDYVYRTLYAGLGENVEKIIIESGGKQKILLPDPQDEDYNNIGALVRVLAIDSVAKDASRAGEEAAKITISWSGKTDVWTFLQYDENSLYLLDINGNDQSFVVTKASLDEILSQAGLQ